MARWSGLVHRAELTTPGLRWPNPAYGKTQRTSAPRVWTRGVGAHRDMLHRRHRAYGQTQRTSAPCVEREVWGAEESAGLERRLTFVGGGVAFACDALVGEFQNISPTKTGTSESANMEGVWTKNKESNMRNERLDGSVDYFPQNSDLTRNKLQGPWYGVHGRLSDVTYCKRPNKQQFTLVLNSHHCRRPLSINLSFSTGGELALTISMGKRKQKVRASDNGPSGEYIAEAQGSQYVRDFEEIPAETISNDRESKEKKAKSHRKASAAYDARNLEATRERRRLRMAATRAAVKLKRRQWDPPKAPRARTPSPAAPDKSETNDDLPVEEGALWELRTENIWILEAQLEPRIRELEALHSTGARLNLVSEMGVELTASLNSDEHVALAALAGMAGGAVGYTQDPDVDPDVEVDSILEMARLLSSHGTEAGEGPCVGQAACVPEMVAPIRESLHVHQAQMAVAALSARPFHPLEVSQVMRWEEVSPSERPPRLPMTFAAYWRVFRWRKKTAKRGDNRWDCVTADAMTELANSLPVDRMLERVWNRIIELGQ
ncbi:hypothetical protein DFH09DRAFT_1092895 [Mycena vulgaris]|nr:hypothetical protein DFH09DRAFT_1092895 [Mycena vulgaris]